MKAARNSLYAPFEFVDEQICRTKNRSLFAVAKLDGISPDCLPPAALEHLTNSLHAAYKTLDPALRVSQYLIKRQGSNVAYHRADRLYTICVHWCFCYEPGSRREWTEEQLGGHVRTFRRLLDSLGTALQQLGLRMLGQEACFAFLRELAQLGKDSEPLAYCDQVDYWMGRSGLNVITDGRRLWVGDKALACLTLKEPPRKTVPGMLQAFLSMPGEFILCSQSKRLSAEQAIGPLFKAQDNAQLTKYAKDGKSAVAMAMNKGNTSLMTEDASKVRDIKDLDEIVVRVQNEGEFILDYELTLLLTAPSQEALNKPIADAQTLLGNFEGAWRREWWGLDALCGIVPGNDDSAYRRLRIASKNWADLTLAYAPDGGQEIHPHLNQPALCVLETNYGTPYHFNLHESDLLGALIFGIMGSGKSFTTNAFVDHSQKYNPFTFILDVGGSYKHLTKKHGGSYLQLAGRNEGFSINPFSLEKNAKNLEFLSTFVHVLLGNSGHLVTPSDSKAIDGAVRTATRLSTLGLPAHLQECLYNWVGDGRYAYLFDNDLDTLEIASFQTFDLQGVSDKIVEPLFFYLFNRISQVVYNPANAGRPKQLFSDEAWKFLNTPAARTYFLEAGKTWRKHNGGICLVTQSALDLERAGLLDCINEICPTKILLANPGANKAYYQQIFELNEREAELFGKLIPKRQILVKTPTRSNVLNVVISARDSWQYRNDPFSNAKRDQYIAQYGYEEGLDRLAEAV